MTVPTTIRILTEHGSGDDFHRWVHEITRIDHYERRPRVLEVANWPISEEERQRIIRSW